MSEVRPALLPFLPYLTDPSSSRSNPHLFSPLSRRLRLVQNLVDPQEVKNATGGDVTTLYPGGDSDAWGGGDSLRKGGSSGKEEGGQDSSTGVLAGDSDRRPQQAELSSNPTAEDRLGAEGDRKEPTEEA
ncbi:hypothetical protein JCM8547_002193 [Rhodosporidiobolus lusitaniae]